MNDILSGTYKGNTYRIKVECYPNTPAIKVQLLPVNAGDIAPSEGDEIVFGQQQIGLKDLLLQGFQHPIIFPLFV